MLTAALYQTFYLLLVAFLSFWITRQYATVDYMGADKGYVSYKNIAMILTVFLIFFIGFRPANPKFQDMLNYIYDYNFILKGKPFEFTWETTNFIFDNILNYWGAAMIPMDYFFFLIAIIYFGGIFLACKKMFPDDTLLMLLVYLGAFSTFSYGTNGIKAGAAASVFLLALAYKENKVLSVLLLVASYGFHHSMAAPIAAFILSTFVKERKYYLYGWLFCLLMAALHVTYFQSLFGGYADESGTRYLTLNAEIKDVSGFRPDFILYSAIPIFLGEYLIRKFQIESETYSFLWRVYVTSNAVFLLCTYASFINRIAYLSWLMYPFVLLYPFLNTDLGVNQYKYLRYAVYGHLGFTLFMSFVYYGI